MTGLRLVEGLDTTALSAATGFDLSNLADSDRLDLAMDSGFLVRDGADFLEANLRTLFAIGERWRDFRIFFVENGMALHRCVALTAQSVLAQSGAPQRMLAHFLRARASAPRFAQTRRMARGRSCKGRWPSTLAMSTA